MAAVMAIVMMGRSCDGALDREDSRTIHSAQMITVIIMLMQMGMLMLKIWR